MSWLSVSDILALQAPSLPTSRRGLEQRIDAEGWAEDTRLCRPRKGRGGGYLYHVDLLPEDAQTIWMKLTPAERQTPAEGARSELWRRFEKLPRKTQDIARDRHAAVVRVDNLVTEGRLRGDAVTVAAQEAGCSPSTLWSWLQLADSVDQADRLAALAPRRTGRTATADCDPRAWEFLKADYLRQEQPAMRACYRRLVETAELEGWSPIPAERTLKRRLEREIPAAARVMAREGADAARKLFPHQTRDRGVFHAMQAVNMDGHTFDVFVEDGGKPFRPVMVCIQDLYSGMVVAHRLDRSENAHAVRLTIGDMVESFGIPEAIYLDNGRSFASKWISGGAPTRFRFKVQPGEPTGVLTELGIKTHWTTPYSGQSKPIERAFRDLCEEIAKHPACAGAYTGNSPDNKPANYGSKALGFEAFRELVAKQIARHNLRQGRRAVICKGRSFADAFKDSLARPETLVRRATPAQRRLWLLAADNVTCRRPRGEIMLAENRYWAPELVAFAGRKVTVRFDPEALHGTIEVYEPDGRHLVTAECIAAVGFNDGEAARAHSRARRAYVKSLREALRLEQLMDIQKVARIAAAPDPDMPPPEQKVVALATGRRAVAPPASDYEARMNALGQGIRSLSNADVVPFHGGGDD